MQSAHQAVSASEIICRIAVLFKLLLTFGWMLSRTCVLLFFFHLFQGTPAWTQGIDSIHLMLREAHSMDASFRKDSALSYYYSYLAEAYSGQQDTLSLQFIDSLETLLPHSRWNKTEGLLFRARGKYHDRRGEFEQALDQYTEAIASLEKNGDQSELVAYAYILKAFVLNNNGMTDACYATLEKIRPLAERLANKNYLAWILDCYGDHKFYSAYGRQDFPGALSYYQQVEALLPQVKSMMIKADNAHGLAGCYLRLGDEKKALEYRNKALEIAKEKKFHSVIFAVYGDLADVYEEKGNFKEAIHYRLLGIDYAKQTGWIEMEARAHKTTGYTFKQAGDFKQALYHFEQLKEIEDSLARFEVQNRYHELELKYESGQKDLQIEQLKGKNLRMWLYVLAALVLGGLLLLNYYRRTNKQLLLQNLELSGKNLEIKRALTEGQNIERKRMAIELHDNINAKIAAAKWILETINTPDKSQEEQLVINRLVDAMSDIYEDVRFISHNLVPKDIEANTLNELIGQFLQNLSQNQKIKFTFIPAQREPEIGNALKIQAYAMIMELINNIIRHSECQKASVQLNFDDEVMDIRVEDDGKGFVADINQSGTGLKNLTSRVKSVNGSLKISNGLKHGVTVHISIPLRSNGTEQSSE